MKLREKFWLWGHPEGCYNYICKDVSRMTPMEACLYLGIRNTFMVPDGDHNGATVNRRQYNKSFTTLSQVGWECFEAGENPELIKRNIEEAREFKNITCAVFDDFKSPDLTTKIPRYKKIPLENLQRLNDLLHNNDVRRMESWMVLYCHQFGENPQEDEEFQPFMDEFDGVIMWNWWEKNYKDIPKKWEQFKKITPKTKRMNGCYLFDFGENKQATGEAVLFQLDFYREKILLGETEGVVLHTNTMADLDYEAYDAAIEWMEKHGDEEI